MKIPIVLIHPTATVPAYATQGAACFDLTTIDGGVVTPRHAMTFRTGLKVAVPEGHVMLVKSRSGHGFKSGVRLSNCEGVVDSDYRGEIMVRLHNDGNRALFVSEGDRIAQAMIIPVDQCAFEIRDELAATERGEGGFGSTGA